MKKLIFSTLFLIIIVSLQAQVNRTEMLQDLENNQSAKKDQSITATLKSSSRLFGAKDDLTTVILIIPSGSTVKVLGSDSTYLHVVFEENEGYIFKKHAALNEAPADTVTVRQPEPVVQEQEQQAPQKQVSRFSYLESKYGSNMAARLIAGKIWKGMTAEMVRDSWGSPVKINRVIRNNSAKEEWIFKNTWLYIENNSLVEWGPISR
jgi:hypothetical protein